MAQEAEVLAPVAAEALPAGQSVQLVDPALLAKLPAAQDAQAEAEAAPDALEAVPAGHARHAIAPDGEAEYVPAAQAVQDAAPADELKRPVGQLAQSASVLLVQGLAMKLPAEHVVHGVHAASPPVE